MGLTAKHIFFKLRVRDVGKSFLSPNISVIINESWFDFSTLVQDMGRMSNIYDS